MNKQFRVREELGQACQARFEKKINKTKNAEKNKRQNRQKPMVKTVEPTPRRNGPDIAAQWGRLCDS